MNVPRQPDFSSEFASLTPDQQVKVLSFIRQIQSDSYRDRRRKALLELAGSISHEDIEAMNAAIKEDCERIDADGW